ncbi:hypothetical protein [Methanococcoides burtonii]|uniref:hypothetical protein n=1 Tax=Methanococcoides burtonii TaxID=29291 RepID=UPI0000398F4A|nr:hypothetical protein [Methanococcoides burtonii]
MKNLDLFVDAGNVKFLSAYRDSMYHVIREKDHYGLFKKTGITGLFNTAFSIGYHFDEQTPIDRKNAINHVNLVSIDRSVKELMVLLVLKRKPQINDPKYLWAEVEMYAEYGIQVMFNTFKNKNDKLVISSILENN